MPLHNIAKRQLFQCALIFFLLTFFAPKIVFAKIIINEIGAFEKANSEWIEILNIGNEPVDITDWKFFENATNHGLAPIQGDAILLPGEFAIIAQKADIFLSEKNFSGTIIDSSWSSLKEDGEEISLKDKDGNFIEQFTYIKAANFSLERINPNIDDYTQNNWREHASGHTAGFQNNNYMVTQINNTPEPQVPPSPQNTPQPQISPTPEITSSPQPQESVSPSPSPLPTPSSSPSPSPSLENPLNANATTQESPAQAPSAQAKIEYQKIVISEFLPNPRGADAGKEYIMLFNPNDKEENLLGWTLDDIDGESKPYAIKQNSIIASHGYLKFTSDETKINLDNNKDSVRLFNPDKILADEASYENAKESVPYVRDKKGAWRQKASATRDISSSQKTINEIWKEKSGTRVSVVGTVIAEPSTLSESFFYISDESGGIQIYSSKKDFPLLSLGDIIEVKGALSEYSNEQRIKISQASDIRIVGKEEVQNGAPAKISDIKNMPLGTLVSAHGEMAQCSNIGFYIDDGSGEINVYIKPATNIEKNCADKDEITVTGVLTKNDSGTRILPRYPKDIIYGKILGENFEEEEKSSWSAINPVYFILFGIIIILFVSNIRILYLLKKKS